MSVTQGERCSLCGRAATRKLEEADVSGHPLSQYVCEDDFKRVMQPYLVVQKTLEERIVNILCSLRDSGFWDIQPAAALIVREATAHEKGGEV